ncbi:glycosyltransferase family 4 protein [Methyloterricola oryzae]|uniref:glycosyltransferase family 4 protein n=1 Tax=Methyloterricola oryzae TaxID=1495050 RepID=UPI0005EB6FB1|nr:glycosyltransferase family 4 protein [Methyloterricola oryzae]
MKIALYVNSFLPQIGGRELVVYYLATALTKLGHQVRVIGPGGWWKNRKFKFGYPVYRYPILNQKLPDIVKVSQLGYDCLLNGCDLIHAHVTYPCGYLAARFKRFSRVPLVITPHGVDIHVIPELGHGLRLDPVIAEKITYALESADALTAISASIENSLRDAGAPADKIVSISNGVDLDRFARGSAEAGRAWLGLPENARLLVMVGTYNARKGHEVMVRAMSSVVRAEPNAYLAIVGRRNEVLLPLIESLGLKGKVLCPGQLDFPLSAQVSPSSESRTDHLADLYQAAELYISSGINEGSEGLSLALLDAMAAGVPVVASNISGNRDIVVSGENGILVTPNDSEALAAAVIDVLRQPDWRIKMGQGAKSTASQYGWDTIAQKYLDVYQRVCRK